MARTWLTVRQAAEKAGVTPGTLRRYVHERRMAYSDPGNGVPARGWWEDELEAQLAARPGQAWRKGRSKDAAGEADGAPA